MKSLSDGRDRCLEECRRLEVLLSLYFQAQIWVAEWCWRTQQKAGPDEMQAFTIHAAELDDMWLDREELLAQMMAGSKDNPWVNATRSYDYICIGGRVATSAPGVMVEGTRIERLRFKPHPSFFPYTSFMYVLQKACDFFGKSHGDLLFKYRGCLCEDPMRLVRILHSFKSERFAIMQAIREWYTSARAQIRTWQYVKRDIVDDVPYRPPPDNMPRYSECDTDETQSFKAMLSKLDDSDSRVLWMKLPRQKMAEFLHCSVRTLRRWEKLGEAPGGLSWPRPEKAGGNLVLYDVSRYWSTIQELIPRQRNPERDLQLRDEIFSDKSDFGD